MYLQLPDILIDQQAAAAIWVAVAVLVIVLVLLLVVRWARRMIRRLFAKRHGLSREEVRRRWVRVQQLLNAPDRDTDRLAVIEADTVLDYVLKAMSFPGSTMAQRLNMAIKKYYELKRVWWAHSLRNNIVHEDVPLSRQRARAAVKEFERALRMLGAL